MQALRKARMSVWYQIKGLFEDGSLLGTAYNVYGEADLRAGTAPARPFVYILDFGVNFETRHLPFIILMLDTKKTGMQLGEPQSFYCELTVHVFGRDRGERDDVASAIMEDVDSIALRDFDNEGYPIRLTAELTGDGGVLWESGNIAVNRKLVVEESLANWNTLVTHFWITDANVLTG